MSGNDPQSKGGIARANALNDDERRAIASAGGRARAVVLSQLPTLEFAGELELGGISIPCGVLSNGQRVLSENGIANAILGGRSGASKRAKKASGDDGVPTPVFLAPERLKPFMDKDFIEGPLQPISYRDGRRVVTGYDPRVLRAGCEVWLRARQAGVLQKQQLDKAQRAEELVRALADVGLIALVDEATGYQQFRARDDLQKILAAYVAPELLPWAKRFPDTYYEHLHRVRGWKYESGSNARTAYIGKLTTTLIYEQLPDGVLEELKAKAPKDPVTKRRKGHLHRGLTSEIGHPHLEKQILVVTTLLSVADSWDDFCKMFAKRFPPGPDDLFSLPAPTEM